MNACDTTPPQDLEEHHRRSRAPFLFGCVLIWVATLFTSLAMMWSPSWMNEDGPFEIVVGVLHAVCVLFGLVTLVSLTVRSAWQDALLTERIAGWMLAGCAVCSLWLRFA